MEKDEDNKLLQCEVFRHPRTIVEKKVEETGRSVDSSCMEQNIMPVPKPALIPNSYSLLPGEHADIRIDVNGLLANGIQWLAVPNSNYGGRCPSDLIGTADEKLLRQTLRSVIFSGMA